MMQIHRVQQNLLTWFDEFGRKDLPWQHNKSGYSVWISEIMLQQTQVQTVIPYFLRFIAQFPSISALASAPEEAVLHLWTGLGYYARARNLHKTAQIIQTEYQGHFPTTIESLIKLPGIGRSTAAAVLSLSAGQHHAILDGNVKRILCRLFKVESWSGRPDTIKQLWQLTEQITPKERCADFNQALMDLGASLCSRSKPSCNLCPLKTDCQAFQENQTDQYPKPRPKKNMPEREGYFLMLTTARQEVLLEKRPSTGIWGGLWSLPQLQTAEEIEAWLKDHQFETADLPIFLPSFRHTFTHFHLLIKPIQIKIEGVASQGFDVERYCWYHEDKHLAIGMPTPVLKLLQLK